MLTKINAQLKRRKGFTLVELLLVVAILAVLAFLAIPAIAETIKNSRMRTCASNERMIETNIWRWYADGIAAGMTVDAADTTADGDGPIAIADFDTILEDATPTHDWPSLTAYFTPGGYPNCPFTDNAEAYEVYYVITDGGLVDVLCVCDDSTEGGSGEDHPRSADRPLVADFPDTTP